MPLGDIKNFVPVSDHLGTAGQPSEAQLRDVAAAGFAVVVNLGLLDPRYCLRDEAAPSRRWASRITTSRWTSTRRRPTTCGGSST